MCQCSTNSAPEQRQCSANDPSGSSVESVWRSTSLCLGVGRIWIELDRSLAYCKQMWLEFGPTWTDFRQVPQGLGQICAEIDQSRTEFGRILPMPIDVNQMLTDPGAISAISGPKPAIGPDVAEIRQIGAKFCRIAWVLASLGRCWSDVGRFWPEFGLLLDSFTLVRPWARADNWTGGMLHATGYSTANGGGGQDTGVQTRGGLSCRLV